MQVKNEIDISINNSKNQLNAIKEEIYRKRLEVYKQNNIDIILKLTKGSSSDSENANKLDQMLNDIKTINGGYQGYSELVKQLRDYEADNDRKALEMKGIIEEDYKRDQKFKNETGMEVLDIKQASNGLLESFEKHGRNLTAAMK